MPVHPHPTIVIRQPTLALGNTSSLQRRDANQNSPKHPTPGSIFGKDKPTGPLEPTKLVESEAKTKPKEAKRPNQFAPGNGVTWAGVRAGRKRVKNSESWNVQWNQQDNQKKCEKHPHLLSWNVALNQQDKSKRGARP